VAQDWITAFALMLVIEGLLYALFPDLMRKAITAALETSPDLMRFGGVISIILGVVIVWLTRT